MTVTISDTGCGVPAEKTEWVFEQFTKIDEFIPGMGMGLTLCRAIVTRLEGLVYIDKEYIGWVEELKSRYRRAQIKAAVKVNAEQLLFNWQLGRDLVIRKAEEKWGSGVVEQVSMDLQAAFPESKGFSTSNLWRMKQWYLFYADSEEKLAQLGREISDVPSSTNDSIAESDHRTPYLQRQR